VTGQERLALACSAERPTVAAGQGVRLRAWAESVGGPAPRYDWTAPVGQLTPKGAQAHWDLANLPAGRYAATVRLQATTAASDECVVRVIVRPDDVSGRGEIGPPGPPTRETGSALLAADQVEVQGYGLYSYVLLGARPGDVARERVLKVIDAVVNLAPEIGKLERYVPRRELNVVYLPVTEASAPPPTPEWVLGNYDYARARSLLRLRPGGHHEGPYILSVLRPPAGGPPASGPPSLGGSYLFQELSRVPPHLAGSWVKEFLNQAAQERFWEERTSQRLALKLRLTVSVLGEGLPEVHKALDTWIVWGK
jgi:hypothetical protein